MTFHYVYLLISETDTNRHYTGLTENLTKRLKHHNSGQCAHTSKHRPWQIDSAISFRSREKAAAFERYLKSHSGRAFAKKHLSSKPRPSKETAPSHQTGLVLG